MLVHGTYRWLRKVVAFRNDYCLTCDEPRLAFQHRTLDVHHVFFIPILPLGFWKRWHCSVCGNNPHESGRTRTSFKWAGIAALPLMTLLGWIVSPSVKPDDEGFVAFIWSLRILCPILFVWALRVTVKAPPVMTLKERLGTVQPIVDPTCPVCRIMLSPTEPAWQCPQCGMQRLALTAA